MKFTPQKIPEVVLIEPQVHGDARGYFVETFRLDLLEEEIGKKAIRNFQEMQKGDL